MVSRVFVALAPPTLILRESQRASAGLRLTRATLRRFPCHVVKGDRYEMHPPTLEYGRFLCGRAARGVLSQRAGVSLLQAWNRLDRDCNPHESRDGSGLHAVSRWAVQEERGRPGQ